MTSLHSQAVPSASLHSRRKKIGLLEDVALEAVFQKVCSFRGAMLKKKKSSDTQVDHTVTVKSTSYIRFFTHPSLKIERIFLKSIIRLSLRSSTQTHSHSQVRASFPREYRKGSGNRLAKVQLPSQAHKHTRTHTQGAHLAPISGDYIAFQTHLRTQAVKLKTNLSQHTQIQAYNHAPTRAHTLTPTQINTVSTGRIKLCERRTPACTRRNQTRVQLRLRMVVTD